MKTVFYKKDITKTPFTENQVKSLNSAEYLMNEDFKGTNYNPNFPVNFESLCNYLDKFTAVKGKDFNTKQIAVIKNIYCL